MFKFNKSFAAVAMAVVSIAASAQDTNKSDFFNQESSAASTSVTSNMGDAAASNGTARKIRITNGQVSELGTGVERGETAGTDRDGNDVTGRNPQRRQNLHSQRKTQIDTEKEPSEFQKFIADNTGKLLPIFGSEFFEIVKREAMGTSDCLPMPIHTR
jgi:hypothetical protein